MEVNTAALAKRGDNFPGFSWSWATSQLPCLKNGPLLRVTLCSSTSSWPHTRGGTTTKCPVFPGVAQFPWYLGFSCYFPPAGTLIGWAVGASFRIRETVASCHLLPTVSWLSAP